MSKEPATKVIALYPRLDGRGFTSEEWEEGKKRINPAGDWDVVETINIVDFFRPHVEVTFEDYGEVWLMDYITHIYYKNVRYTEVRNQKKADRRDQGASG